VFQGKYRVDAILGHGGMGVVAECTHLALNERVAVKMLRQDVLADQDAVSRFIREAQAAVKLKSEYVARVSDVGTFENGVPYMVMEFLEGHDLGQLLEQRGVLPVQWCVELMLQTAEALAEAHSLGIVHRDVKPTNLFVTWRPDGSALIKVLDFGISKSPMGTDMNLTQTQSLLGTPAYMSPEQMRSARLVDTRTDIWSLGTVFYETLEGRRPFEAESFSEMCVKVAVDAPAPMVNTPPNLQQVILRCLAKSPEQRYATMAEFAQDLVPYAPDPHAAQTLVERMTRMLRRSTYDWDSAGTSGGSGRVSRELGTGPVQRASTPVPLQFGSGSDPAARALSDTPARTPVDHGTTASLRKKPSRVPLILILLGCLGAAGAGFAVWSAKDKQPATAASHQAETVTPMKVEPTVPAPAPAPVEPAPVADVPVETKPEIAAQPDDKPAPKKPTAAKAKPKKTPKAKPSAAPPTAPEPKTIEKPPPKPCNPFDSMHGCDPK
jgi:serine/threonine protein kinase